MTNEKVAKIGAAHLECKSAGDEREYINQRAERVAAAMKAVSDCMFSERQYRPRVENGKLIFPYSSRPFSPSDLVDEAGLIALLESMAKADERLLAAHKALAELEA